MPSSKTVAKSISGDVGCSLSSSGGAADFSRIDGMAWTKPKHTRGQVDRAGAAARRVELGEIVGEADEGYLDVISNWRAAHGYPLHNFHRLVRRRAANCDVAPIVVHRLKRLESIVDKLGRFDTLQLSQMQDIAGCRAVLSSLACVNEVAASLRGIDHKFSGIKDYIAAPKDDGYRGIHLMFRYEGSGNAEAYNGLRVEVQVRTALQHAWATAVEAVDAFTDQALKSNRGGADWLRFFALMGSKIAVIEGCSLVPGTPAGRSELSKEIRELSRELDVVKILRAYRATADYSGRADGHYYLLRLHFKEGKLAVRKYGIDQLAVATEDYMLTERDAHSTGEMVVLVSAESLTELKKAFPNYFLDMGKFLSLLKRA